MPLVADQSPTAENRAADELVQQLHPLFFLSAVQTQTTVRNVEYSILLMMSELSTVRCDRALGLWIAGTRALSVDGELPWRCCGLWTVRWTALNIDGNG